MSPGRFVQQIRVAQERTAQFPKIDKPLAQGFFSDKGIAELRPVAKRSFDVATDFFQKVQPVVGRQMPAQRAVIRLVPGDHHADIFHSHAFGDLHEFDAFFVRVAAGKLFGAAQTNPHHQVVSDFLADGLDQFGHEPGPVFHGPAVFVGPLIRVFGIKVGQQIPGKTRYPPPRRIRPRPGVRLLGHGLRCNVECPLWSFAEET